MAGDCTLEDCSVEGFKALKLSNGLVSLVVIPAMGGKIASLVHQPSGKEWLWKNPYLKYASPVYGASYIREFDFGGIDECFPSIGAVDYPSAPWQGTPVPDHGEVWALPWTVREKRHTADEIVLALDCYGVRFPYHFERRVTLQRGKTLARLDYRVTNLSPFPFPFIWSIHPLVQSEPGMRLALPACVANVRVDLATNDWLGPAGTLLAWPLARRAAGGDPVDLSVIQPPALHQGVKYYTLPLSGAAPVETTLSDRSGRSFTFRFLPSEVTHVGIWMNCAGWTPIDQPPYYNLAFEPCIGGSDSLTLATQKYHEYAVLAAQAEKRWSLEIELA